MVGPAASVKPGSLWRSPNSRPSITRTGALFVGLSKVDDPALVSTEIAAALGRRHNEPPPAVDRLQTILSTKELLLVLDNFEHLLVAAPAVADLIAAAPRLRVITTSRAPLRIRGEQLFELDPLAVPTTDDPMEVGGSDSVQLFLQLALAADRRLTVDHELMRHARADLPRPRRPPARHRARGRATAHAHTSADRRVDGAAAVATGERTPGSSRSPADAQRDDQMEL